MMRTYLFKNFYNSQGVSQQAAVDGYLGVLALGGRGPPVRKYRPKASCQLARRTWAVLTNRGATATKSQHSRVTAYCVLLADATGYKGWANRRCTKAGIVDAGTEAEGGQCSMEKMLE